MMALELVAVASSNHSEGTAILLRGEGHDCSVQFSSKLIYKGIRRSDSTRIVIESKYVDSTCYFYLKKARLVLLLGLVLASS